MIRRIKSWSILGYSFTLNSYLFRIFISEFSDSIISQSSKEFDIEVDSSEENDESFRIIRI